MSELLKFIMRGEGKALELKDIVKLKTAGIIERIGADRGGYWRIIE